MEWIYVSCIVVFFIVEIVLYVVGRAHGRNTLLEHVREIIETSRHISDELFQPKTEVHRLCGLLVGLSVLWAATMFFVSVLAGVLIPFELQEWPQRVLFGLASLTAGVFFVVVFRRLNVWLLGS